MGQAMSIFARHLHVGHRPPHVGGCQSYPLHNERERSTQAGRTENAAYLTLIF